MALGPSYDILRPERRNPSEISLNVMVSAPPMFERQRHSHNHFSVRRSLPQNPNSQHEIVNSFQVPEISVNQGNLISFPRAKRFEEDDNATLQPDGSLSYIPRPATSIGITVQSRKASNVPTDPTRPSTSVSNYMAFDPSEKSQSSSNMVSGCVAEAECEIPPLDISIVREEDHENYPLPVESDRWYRRSGWKSQRVSHFRTPLDPENFLQSSHLESRRSVANRRMAEWLWNVDLSARRWHWQRVCKLRPAAEIFSFAHLRSVQRDAEARRERPPTPVTQRRTERSETNEQYWPSTQKMRKDPVGEEPRRVNVAVELLLQRSSITSEGSWRERVRASRGMRCGT